MWIKMWKTSFPIGKTGENGEKSTFPQELSP
jgi:hypothetical protein